MTNHWSYIRWVGLSETFRHLHAIGERDGSSFIGVSLLDKCLSWYELAQITTNKAPTSKDKMPDSNWLCSIPACPSIYNNTNNHINDNKHTHNNNNNNDNNK